MTQLHTHTSLLRGMMITLGNGKHVLDRGSLIRRHKSNSLKNDVNDTKIKDTHLLGQCDIGKSNFFNTLPCMEHWSWVGLDGHCLNQMVCNYDHEVVVHLWSLNPMNIQHICVVNKIWYGYCKSKALPPL